MFGLPVNYWVAIALGVLGVGWTFRAWIPDLVSGATSLLKRSPAVPAKPVRLEALAHLDAAFSYFEAIGCKEGMEAIRTAGQHAFEHREDV
jgi:hypothetical protein